MERRGGRGGFIVRGDIVRRFVILLSDGFFGWGNSAFFAAVVVIVGIGEGGASAAYSIGKGGEAGEGFVGSSWLGWHGWLWLLYSCVESDARWGGLLVHDHTMVLDVRCSLLQSGIGHTQPTIYLSCR